MQKVLKGILVQLQQTFMILSAVEWIIFLREKKKTRESNKSVVICIKSGRLHHLVGADIMCELQRQHTEVLNM